MLGHPGHKRALADESYFLHASDFATDRYTRPLTVAAIGIQWYFFHST